MGFNVLFQIHVTLFSTFRMDRTEHLIHVLDRMMSPWHVLLPKIIILLSDFTERQKHNTVKQTGGTGIYKALTPITFEGVG